MALCGNEIYLRIKVNRWFEYLICTKHYEYYKDISTTFKKAATKYGISNSHHRTGFVECDSDEK